MHGISSVEVLRFPGAARCRRAGRRAVLALGLLGFWSGPVVAQGDSVYTRSARASVRLAGPRYPDGDCTDCTLLALQRPHVAQLSNGYYTRLRIHLIASYVTLPVMATEYVLGERLINDERAGVRGSPSLTGAHGAVALTLGGLFALNTVTGALNLYEARHIPEGRARRTIHALLMLAADGGFAYTASLGGSAKLRRPGGTLPAGADPHRRAAIISISVATASTVMMWLWKR